MIDKYDHPTAHRLEPVKGWDAMSHMDFVAPMASTVTGAPAGTVMHMNTNGALETGLTDQSMGLFLYYKQYDDDTINDPTTLNGQKLTSISLNSANTITNGPWESHYQVQNGAVSGSVNGIMSNMGSYNFTRSNVTYKAQGMVHTTYPGACGMELSSTEFAQKMADGTTSVTYTVNDALTSPVANSAFSDTSSTTPGTASQNKFGGFLKRGTPYEDPICGVVSRVPYKNTNGYSVICFWAQWLPALTTAVSTALTTQTINSAITSACASGGAIDTAIDSAIAAGIADGGVIDSAVDTLISAHAGG